MNIRRVIPVILVCIIILLIIGISSAVKYNDRVQMKNQTSKVKDIVIYKNKEQEEIIDIKNDIDEEFIEEKEEYIETNITNEINTSIEEHHELKEEIPTYISQLNEIKHRNDILGTAGRLYIPNVDINVGLNNANIYNNDEYNAQDIVDKQDSAAYYTFASKLTIADHDFQGFNRIGNLNSGDKAFIKRNDGSVEEYQMINSFIGKNIGSDLIDLNGNSIGNMTGNLIMYTCYGLDNIMVTLWNKVS